MLRDRARSAAILVPPLLVALWFGEPWVSAVVVLVVLLAAVEAFRLLTAAGALYVGLLGYVDRLAGAGPAVDPSAPLGWLGPGRAWVLILVLGVWAYDTAAYFVGRRFGRNHFIPHISPGKTAEGVGGGLAAVVIVSAVLVAAVGRSMLGGAFLGLAIGLAGQAGDLAESMLKRAAGAKESGRLIPGHGGMLDRVDSFLFAAPVAFLYVTAAFR